jgi:uncharacterized protein YndB with AHSA1/START domain
MASPDRSVLHSTFSIEKTYRTSPARVFAAWSRPETKRRWFGGTDEALAQLELDFTVGGRETNRGIGPNGAVYLYDARYCDIVADQRIVYSYEMYMNDTRISVSIGTVELEAVQDATRLVYTEQGVYLDGLDTPADREHGTRELLNALEALLERAATTA